MTTKTTKDNQNVVIKYWGIWFPLVISIATFFSGYKLLEYKVAVLESQIGKSASGESIRTMIREENEQFNRLFKEHGELHQRIMQMNMKRNAEIDGRIQAIERALYRKGML